MGAKNSSEARIIAAATELYAEHGFDVPVARIARAARVSPAAVRRQGTKLRERVFAANFTGRWKPEWEALLRERSIPFEKRLARFFSEYRGNITRTNARLWTRAGLLGMHESGNFSATLAKRVLKPIALELRQAAGVSSKRALSGREIELVQMLHGAIAFPHTRSHIFGMRWIGRLPDLVAMMVRVWLPGAKAEMRRLHA
ncbi:MAG: TetR family transcriptional regulator [Betaproteobacteria bacterium]